MIKKSLRLSQVYRLIEPGPVVLLTTEIKGHANVMTMSWHMMVEFEPPTIACIVSNRNHSFKALKKTKECVLNIPTAKLAKKVVLCGNTTGRDIDKFQKIGLTPTKARLVAPPLIDECYASLECRVIDSTLVASYGMFILEVVKAWMDPAEAFPPTLHHRGRGIFSIDGKTIQLPSRMK